MQQANCLTAVVCQCADEKLPSDAIEWAILTGRIELTYTDLKADIKTVMDNYDTIISDYQRSIAEMEAQLVEIHSPLYAEIARVA